MDDFKTVRDQMLSVYQSAVTDIAHQLQEQSLKSAPGRRSALGVSHSSALPALAGDIAEREYALKIGATLPDGPIERRRLTKPEIGRVCAQWTLDYMKAQLEGDAAAIKRLDDEFEAGTCDLAWRTTVTEYLKYFGLSGKRREIPYIRAATVGAQVIQVKSDARIALVGDWGTGAPPAIQVLKHIADAKPDILVHLGDIYYSGTPTECERNFLEPINRVLRKEGRTVQAYTLSGNHDMYCGGVGFYDLITKTNPAPFTQPASFFCLRSEDQSWQLLAMDTGLHDYSPLGVTNVITYLEDDELEWHRQRIEEFPGRTILLSHHQLFSAFSGIGPAGEGKRSALNPRLYAAYQILNKTGKIAAWFWGHEHALSVYQPFEGLDRGRCLGHGAVPTSLLEKIYDPLKDLEKTPEIIAKTELSVVCGVWAHGWATLRHGANGFTAEYFQDLDGRSARIHEETFA